MWYYHKAVGATCLAENDTNLTYDGIGAGCTGALWVISDNGLAHHGSILSDLLPFLLNNNITNNTNTSNQHNNYNKNNTNKNNTNKNNNNNNNNNML